MNIQEYHETVAERLIAAIEAGTAPWLKPWLPGETALPFNAVTRKQYQGINPILLMSTGYGDPRWIGFAQAKAKGARVRKGEKGTPIIRVMPARPLLDDDGAPELDDDGQQRRLPPRIKVLHVWNVNQVDGLDLPPIGKPPEKHEWEACERAEQAITRSGVQVENVGGDRAFYNRTADRIVLPMREQFPTALGYYHTALHELAHASGHPDRLNRPTLVEHEGFGTEKYAREELVAEIASVMAGARLGTGSEPQHGAAYCKSWIKALRDDTREIVRAAHNAQLAANWICAS